MTDDSPRQILLPTTGKIMLLVFCVALLARAAHFAIMAPYFDEWSREKLPRNDWLNIARHVAAGDGYQNDTLLTYFQTDRPLVPTAARGPVPVFVFAAVLKTFDDWYYPLLWLSWGLSATNAVLTFWIGYRATGSRAIGLGAGLLFALYLREMYIATAFAAGSEPVFSVALTTFLLLSMIAADRGTTATAAAAGLALGIAFLCRQYVLFAIGLPAVWLLLRYRRQAIKPVVVLFAVFAATLAPWVVRNFLTFGAPVLTTTLGGYNIYRHNLMIGDNEYYWATAHDEFDPLVERLLTDAGYDMNTVTEVQIDQFLKLKSRELILTYPLRYMRLSLYRVAWIWYKNKSGRGLYLVQNGLIYLLAAVGAVAALRARNAALIFLLAMLAYTVALHAAINAQYRFLSPMMPVIMILAALGISRIYAWFLDRARPSTAG